MAIAEKFYDNTTLVKISNIGKKPSQSITYIENILHGSSLTLRITINVPLFKKLRDIIFFCGTITL